MLAPKTLLCVCLASCSFAWAAGAQAPNPYGAPIGVELARRLAVAAISECRKSNLTVAAAIVDGGGTLVYFERIDGTQNGSSEVAIAKAKTAAAYKRPSKAFEEALASGRPGMLNLPGVMPLDGGFPLISDGKIIGAIGVSGATSQQDGVCAQAGVAVLEKGAAKPPAKK
jgi:glc operon protein GlcG